MRKFLMLAIVYFTSSYIFPCQAQTSGVLHLSWNANKEPDLAGYNVYRSTRSGGGYVKINSSLIADTTYVDTGLTFGVTYYYVVTAVDSSSNESGYSNEASGTPWALRKIFLKQGDNLISFNVSPPNDSLNVLLSLLPPGSCTYIAGFSEGRWRTWAAGRPDFLNDLKKISPLHGLWINMNSPAMFEVYGVPVPPDTPVQLLPGPNLVSYLPDQPDSLYHALNSISGFYTYVAGFSEGRWRTWAAGRPDFLNDLKVLYPGQAYWITVPEDTVLRYPSEGYRVGRVAKLALQTEPSTDLLPSPYVCDFWGLNDGSLKVGDTITAVDPDGVTCGMTVVRDGRGFLIHVFGDDPMTPDIDEGAREGDPISFYINGHKIQQTAFWKGMASTKIALSATSVEGPSNLPAGYRLYQNFPNPFNSWTQIMYQLPERSEVEIAVYNLAGQRVRLLTNGVQEPGYHLISWDGKDERGVHVGSGIYLCRMTAGRFTETKRMILLR